MDKVKLQETIALLEEAEKQFEAKKFNVYFFVLDSKGNPSSTLRYIYQTAWSLKERGYKVTMLHQEEEFVGVGDWLGDLYASLPHKNIEKQNVEISASDFLFIPEIYANVMSQTKNLPCKRVALLTNMNYLTEVIPVGVTWGDLGIHDVVTTTPSNVKKIQDYFPSVRASIVPPYIPSLFRGNDEPRDLVINFLSKDPTNINKVIKPFFWKYPIFKWVSFRDLRGIPQDTFADALRDSAMTIWIDDDTNIGTSLIESVKCGCLTLAKIPDNPTDWMLDEKGELKEGIIWFDDINDLPRIIASVVRTWINDAIPTEIYDNAKQFDGVFSKAEQEKAIDVVYVNNIFKKRKDEITETKVRFQGELNKE